MLLRVYGANLLMVINQTESRQTINSSYGYNLGGENTGGTFDIKIFQLNSKRPVWRANLKADGRFGLSTAANKAIEKLI